MGRNSVLNDSQWETARGEFVSREKSWRQIAREYKAKGVKISHSALSQRYTKEKSTIPTSNPQPKKKKSGKIPPDNGNSRNLIGKLEMENIELRQRLGLLEGVVELLVKKEIEPKGKLLGMATCPACGIVSKGVKSHFERRFYCRNKDCSRKTFIATKEEKEERVDGKVDQ